MDGYVTFEEAREALGVSESTMRRRIRDGHIEHIRDPTQVGVDEERRRILIPVHALPGHEQSSPPMGVQGGVPQNPPQQAMTGHDLPGVSVLGEALERLAAVAEQQAKALSEVATLRARVLALEEERDALAARVQALEDAHASQDVFSELERVEVLIDEERAAREEQDKRLEALLEERIASPAAALIEAKLDSKHDVTNDTPKKTPSKHHKASKRSKSSKRNDATEESAWGDWMPLSDYRKARGSGAPPITAGEALIRRWYDDMNFTSQIEAAQALGTGKSTFRQWLKGEGNPTNGHRGDFLTFLEENEPHIPAAAWDTPHVDREAVFNVYNRIKPHPGGFVGIVELAHQSNTDPYAFAAVLRLALRSGEAEATGTNIAAFPATTQALLRDLNITSQGELCALVKLKEGWRHG